MKPLDLLEEFDRGAGAFGFVATYEFEPQFFERRVLAKRSFGTVLPSVHVLLELPVEVLVRTYVEDLDEVSRCNVLIDRISERALPEDESAALIGAIAKE